MLFRNTNEITQKELVKIQFAYTNDHYKGNSHIFESAYAPAVETISKVEKRRRDRLGNENDS